MKVKTPKLFRQQGSRVLQEAPGERLVGLVSSKQSVAEPHVIAGRTAGDLLALAEMSGEFPTPWGGKMLDLGQ